MVEEGKAWRGLSYREATAPSHTHTHTHTHTQSGTYSMQSHCKDWPTNSLTRVQERSQKPAPHCSWCSSCLGVRVPTVPRLSGRQEETNQLVLLTFQSVDSPRSVPGRQ
jgi:hypothetical protein